MKLAKIYTKYQEAVDALRHEQLGRKQSEAILERVFLDLFFMRTRIRVNIHLFFSYVNLVHFSQTLCCSIWSSLDMILSFFIRYLHYTSFCSDEKCFMFIYFSIGC